LACH